MCEHVQGVWERDEWRGNDSFESFAEVFDAAKQHGADCMLLGGDLFHENKPSRNTVIKCLDILNRNCLGDKPIAFEVRPQHPRSPSRARAKCWQPRARVVVQLHAATHAGDGACS